MTETLSGTPHNLPAPVTSFVGRRHELSAVKALLRQSRLVTLSGAAGSGKTRLATEVAGGALDRYPDGVWLVDLAAVERSELVVPALARSLAGGQSEQLEALAVYLEDRRVLIILDNCDHLVEPCASVAQGLLGRCRALRLLVTSRQPLGLSGEVVWRVAPLDDEDAARLFVERAKAHRPDFTPIGEAARDVREICRHLDRLPLAIELAAAWVRMMTPGEILPRLGDRFTLLGGGRGTVLPRQEGLRAAIDWSHQLLDEEERQLFRRLAVFAASFALDAVEALGQPGALGVLGRLVDKSMVAVEPVTDGQTRYRLLETLQAYARERLVEADEVELARTRHLDHYLARAEELYERRWRAGSGTIVRELDHDYDNLRAALALCRSTAPRSGLRLAGAMLDVWFRLGNAEGRRWATEFLSMGPRRDSVRARALFAAGVLAVSHQSHAEARSFLEESRDISVELEDRHGEAWALDYLGVADILGGNSAGAREKLERSLTIFESLADRLGTAKVLANLGQAAVADLDRQEEAQHRLGRALELAEAIGDRWLQGHVHTNLGLAEVQRGEADAAASHFRCALRLLLEVGDVVILSIALVGQAALVVTSNPRKAARLAGAAVGVRERIGARFPETAPHPIEPIRMEAARSLGREVAQAEWEAGRRMSADDAVALALGKPRRPRSRSELSPREDEVAELVAQGLSNREIAGRLHLSERTVENHVFHILGKLGLDNRTQVAAWALRNLSTD